MKFKLIKKVPIVDIDGRQCFLDTGCPWAQMQLKPGSQDFFGIPGLEVRGVPSLKRFTKIDYASREITTSDEPIPLEGGTTAAMELRDGDRWCVRMTVGGVEDMYFIDTGAAYSYVHGLSPRYPVVGLAEESSPDGEVWTAPMHRVPCEFAGNEFEILCGDMQDNPYCRECGGAGETQEGVIGYDFFNNFTVVVDRVGGTIAFRRNCPKGREVEDVCGDLKEYLNRNFSEWTPSWLKSYRRGRFGRRTLSNFIHSRLVYYPGAGTDLDPLEVFGRSGSAHCFVLVDYYMPESGFLGFLERQGFRGYHVYDSVSVSAQDMFKVVRPGVFHLDKVELQEANRRMRDVHTVPPYARFVVFERNRDESDEVGPDRLALLFMGAEGIATYDVMFASRQAPCLFAFLLQDHGFGGNWDHFGHGGLCEKIAQRGGVFPPFILNGGGDPDAWDGYEKVSSNPAESRSPRGRYLFRRTDNLSIRKTD